MPNETKRDDGEMEPGAHVRGSMRTDRLAAEVESRNRVYVERDEAKALLKDIAARLHDECDVGWHGEPNLAMRLLTEFEDRLARAGVSQ
jgi:hypothetical protein